MPNWFDLGAAFDTRPASSFGFAPAAVEATPAVGTGLNPGLLAALGLGVGGSVLANLSPPSGGSGTSVGPAGTASGGGSGGFGNPFSIFSGIGKLAPAFAQFSNTQFGTNFPTTLSDTLSQFGEPGAAASNVLGSLSQSFGGLGGAILPIVGSLIGGAIGGGDLGRTALSAGTGAVTGVLGNLAASTLAGETAATLAGAGLGGAGGAGLGAAAGGALGGGAATAGIGLLALPAILGLQDAFFGPSAQQVNRAFAVKQAPGTFFPALSRAQGIAQGNFSQTGIPGASNFGANQGLVDTLFSRIGDLKALQTLNDLVSQSGSSEHGIRFPDFNFARPLISAAGRQLLPALIEAQQRVTGAGITEDQLRAGGFPLGFVNGVVDQPTRTDITNATEGTGGAAGPTPVGQVLLNQALAQDYARQFGLTTPLQNLGPTPAFGTPEYRAFAEAAGPGVLPQPGAIQEDILRALAGGTALQFPRGFVLSQLPTSGPLIEAALAP